MSGGIIEGMLIGAAVGGGTSALTGGDPLKGALMGGLTGGIGSGVMGGAAGGGAGGAGSGASTGAATGAASGATSAGITSLPAAATSSALPSAATSIAPMGAAQAIPNAAFSSIDDMIGNAVKMSATPAATPAVGPAFGGMPSFAPNAVPGVMGAPAQAAQVATQTAAAPVSLMDDLKDWVGTLSPKEKLAYGLGGSLGLSMLMETMGAKPPEEEKYKGPLSKFRYDPNLFTPTFPMAEGGIASLGGANIAVGGDPRRNTPPISQDNVPVSLMARGGISSLGSYSDGGRLLKGPGDGMSDHIPAMIGRKQPARLADGEFVVPADVVSHLGNGSTDAGAKQLYAMMDKVRRARTGRKAQGREINPRRYMPA